MNLIVICLIEVVISINSIYFIQKEQIEGKIIKEDINNYLVDFSEEAKKLNLIGEYSSKLVLKTACIKK